jgi:hypothetical protein
MMGFDNKDRFESLLRDSRVPVRSSDHPGGAYCQARTLADRQDDLDQRFTAANLIIRNSS